MQTVTVLAPIKLATGVTEDQLLAASAEFQRDFVSKEPGVLRRELVRKGDGTYIDIVRFRSAEDYADVTEKEMKSPVCAKFFGLMDMSTAEEDMAAMEAMVSLEVY